MIRRALLWLVLSASLAHASPQIQPLDMQTYQINNLGAATAGSDAARFDQIPTPVSTATAVPTFTPITGTGMLAQTAANTFVTRTITGTSNQIDVTNGDGVSGAPMLALASKINDFVADGWVAMSDTFTYSSATAMTTGTSWTAHVVRGDKIFLINSTPKYFYVDSVTSNTINLIGGSSYSLANAAISGVLYSHQPQVIGFPPRLNWTPTLSAASGTFTSTSTYYSNFQMIGGGLNGTLVCVAVGFTGTTSTSTASINFTLPIATASLGAGQFVGAGMSPDGGSTKGGFVSLSDGSTSAACTMYDASNFTAGASRYCVASFCYQGA
jgi:hypothetical protein